MTVDLVSLAPPDAEALVRAIEGAPQVRRRYHFFLWTQGPMQVLLPHELMVCGAYQRSRKELIFEAFHNVAVPAPLLAALTDPRSALLRAAEAAWVAQRGLPVCFDTRRGGLGFDAAERVALAEAGYPELLVHGVSRPQRPNELEALFILASSPRRPASEVLIHLELLLPHLHRAYLRMQGVERDISNVPAPAPPRLGSAPTVMITAREKQILRGVRDGKNNQEIGTELAISPLTVKNHVQKILRKLGAANRAQAVGMAISLQLLAGHAPVADPNGDSA